MAPPFHTASFEQELDFSDLLYYFRPASVRAAHESLGTKSPLSLQAHAGTPTSLVMGRLLKSPEVHGLDIRLASPQEVEGKLNFTACTVPILIASMWPNTLCEFFARVPPAYNHYLQKGVLSRDLSIVLWSPLKLPLTQFNRGIMRAFSHFEPTDFADFSARKPPDAPSTSTYEGRHVRCFRRLLVWKTNRDFKAMLPRTGKEADALHSSVSTDPHKSSVISPSPRPGNALLPAYAEACPAGRCYPRADTIQDVDGVAFHHPPANRWIHRRLAHCASSSSSALPPQRGSYCASTRCSRTAIVPAPSASPQAFRTAPLPYVCFFSDRSSIPMQG